MAVLIFAVVSLCCNKEKLDQIENLNGGHIDIFGHGGMGPTNAFQQFPINSWASITRALNYTSADGVEIDVQITLDSVLVAYHEQDLNYASNCSGCIPEMDFSNIHSCVYISALGQQHELVNVADVFKQYDLERPPLFSLDTKTYLQCIEQVDLIDYVERLAYTYQKLVTDPNRQEHVWIETQSFELVTAIKDLDPAIRVYWLSSDMPAGIDRALELGCDGIVVSNSLITKEMVRSAHDAGLYVSIFGISNRDSHISAINKFPDHIQTDNISIAEDLLR